MESDLDDPRPRYVQVADELRERIAKGDPPVGERLPAARELAQVYGVAMMTINNALRVLQDEGLLVRRPGRGTYVRQAPTAQAPSVQEQLDDLRRRVEALEERSTTDG